MNAREWIISILFVGLLASILAWLYGMGTDWLLGMLFVYPLAHIKIMYCDECRTYTNHVQLKSGEWQCRCATIHKIVEGTSTPEWFESIKPIEF